MSLYDHFVPPLSRTHPWRGFQSAWAAAMVRYLNGGILPPGYYAIPSIDLGGPLEIDLEALQDRQAKVGSSAGETLELWTPAEPTLTLPVDFPPLELVEVQVLYDKGGPRLTAAVELVSSANKDRSETRRAFTVKCVSYLQQGISVLVVDAVTARRANFHAEILRLLEQNDPVAWQSPTDLYTVAYHAVAAEGRRQLQAWAQPLVVGSPLPRMPLWLGADICVPLDLEDTYLATCEALRIR